MYEIQHLRENKFLLPPEVLYHAISLTLETLPQRVPTTEEALQAGFTDHQAKVFEELPDDPQAAAQLVGRRISGYPRR